MIRLLSVDDHKMIHRAIAHMANRQPDLSLIGEASTGEQALEFIDALQPHVVLMDLDMPGMGGIEATEKIRRQFPAVQVIIISGHVHEPYPSRALAAGARGFLSKDVDEDEIERAVRRVLRGECHVSSDVAGHMAAMRFGTREGSPFDELSDRELAVAMKICTGLGTQEISDLLGIHVNTVSTYRRRIYDKVDVSNDVQLTRMAYRFGLLKEGLE